MKKYVNAKMVNDWVPNYKGGKIPVVTESNHPRFTKGTRFDWGFVQVAIGDGYTVTIEPHDVNRSNCTHPDGFVRSGIIMGRNGIDYDGYWCPRCGAERYMLVKDTGEIPRELPTDHKWDYGIGFGCFTNSY